MKTIIVFIFDLLPSDAFKSPMQPVVDRQSELYGDG